MRLYRTRVDRDVACFCNARRVLLCAGGRGPEGGRTRAREDRAVVEAGACALCVTFTAVCSRVRRSASHGTRWAAAVRGRRFWSAFPVGRFGWRALCPCQSTRVRARRSLRTGRMRWSAWKWCVVVFALRFGGRRGLLVRDRVICSILCLSRHAALCRLARRLSTSSLRPTQRTSASEHRFG